MSDQFLDEVFGQEPSPAGRSGRKRKGFDDPTTRIHDGAVERTTVTKSLKAGQYIRRQFTFRPEQLARINRLARSLRVPETDLVRWLVDYGMNAIEHDGVAPQSVDISTTRLLPPG